MPVHHQASLERADAYYADNAADNAAFLTGCAREEITTEVVTTFTDYVRLGTNEFAEIERPNSIGVAACGRRLIYMIICGQADNYVNPGMKDSGFGRPCQVVQEGSAALNAQQQQNEEDEAAARAVTLQQQQRQQRQQR